LPIEFPNVKDHSIETIWRDSQGFNQYRGDSWMQEPCRSCPEKHKDFGGCRCQAYMLTGDATNADPVCDKSPFHQQIKDSVLNASKLQKNKQEPLLRNMPNSRDLIAKE
jgi:pyrroloquinoline quinone biosynthesis protein E